MNRSKPSEECDLSKWVKDRNTQCNFDTILQAISLRSQPESVSDPVKVKVDLVTSDHFGFLYRQKEELVDCWKFTFEVQHGSVFEDDETPLGSLYKDVDAVPMIICGEELKDLAPFLDTTPELRNIYFSRIEDAQ